MIILCVILGLLLVGVLIGLRHERRTQVIAYQKGLYGDSAMQSGWKHNRRGGQWTEADDIPGLTVSYEAWQASEDRWMK